jgi:hypothetical protein
MMFPSSRYAHGRKVMAAKVRHLASVVVVQADDGIVGCHSGIVAVTHRSRKPVELSTGKRVVMPGMHDKRNFDMVRAPGLVRGAGCGIGCVEKKRLALRAAQQLSCRQKQKAGLPCEVGSRESRRLHIKLRQRAYWVGMIVFQKNWIQGEEVSSIRRGLALPCVGTARRNSALFVRQLSMRSRNRSGAQHSACPDLHSPCSTLQ